MVIENTLKSPFTARRSNQSSLKEVNPEFIGKTDAEAEAPILWPPEEDPTQQKRPSCWQRLKAGEKGTPEDEMIRQHQRLNVHEF